METNLSEARDPQFIQRVEALSGQNLAQCYQCGKCTAGCPCAFVYDVQASQLMRYAQQGLKQRALSARSLWMCVSCGTCSLRCPNSIDVAAVLEALRHIALAEGHKDYRTHSFWTAFLQSIRRQGRAFELGIMANFMIRTGRLVTDVDLAPLALARKKLGFKPHFLGGCEEVSRIFQRYENVKKKEEEK